MTYSAPMRRHFALIGALALALAACGKEAAPPAAMDVPSKPAVSPGELKFATVCTGCHGRHAQGMGVFPRLAGRPAEYIKDKLRHYRAGLKYGEMSDTMLPFARPLTDAEIDAIAAYISGLR